MKRWFKRIGGALLMGLAWAAVWTPVGVLLGLAVDWDGSMEEIWVAVGAYPGFLCGALFYAVLGVAAACRRLEDLSLSQAAARGAVSGVLVSAMPFLALATIEGDDSQGWPLALLVLASITGLSAVSGAASTTLAKRRRCTASSPTPADG